MTSDPTPGDDVAPLSGVAMPDSGAARGGDVAQVRVVRPAICLANREKHCPANEPPPKGGLVSRLRSRLKPGGWRAQLQPWVISRVPILHWLPRYPVRSSLLGDVVAGATVGVLHLPQGMGFAVLAGLPPITGLYMAFFPVLVYVLLGTCPHLSQGTFAVSCIMMNKLVTQLSTPTSTTPSSPALLSSSTTVIPDDPLATLLPTTTPPADDPLTTLAPVVSNDDATVYTAQQIGALVALIVGLWEVVLGVLNLGEVFSLFLSSMLVKGFTTGLAFHIVTSQLKFILGVSIPNFYGPFKLFYTWRALGTELLGANPAALIISACAFVVLILNNELLKPRLSKYTQVPLPIELIVVSIGTAVSYLGDLHQLYGLHIVGNIPTGLPAPAVPPVELVPRVLVDCLIIALVCYATSVSISAMYARKYKYTVDNKQELYSQGISNVVGSFFLCGVMAPALSRSVILEGAGGKTLVATAVSCVFVLFALFFVGPIFQSLPYCALSCVIVMSMKPLLWQWRDVPSLWRASRLDALVWLSTFAFTVVLDIAYGLVGGLVMSVAVLVLRSLRPRTALLGHVPHTDFFLDLAKYPTAAAVPGVIIFSFDGPLNFSTAIYFKSQLFRLSGLSLDTPKETKNSTPEEKVELKGGHVTSSKTEETILQLQSPCTEEPHCVGLVGDTAAKQARWLLLDLGGVTYLDTVGARALTELHQDLAAVGVDVCLAAASERVVDALDRCGVLDTVQRHLVFPTLQDAITLLRHPASP